MANTSVSPNNVAVKFKGKKPMAEAAAPSADDRDWEAEDALRTMQRAEEHQQDPDMVKRVATHAKKTQAGLSAVMAKLQKQGLISDKQAAKVGNRTSAARAR